MNIFVWTGIIFGLLIALPTGPVGFITIQRMYSHGIWSGMITNCGSIVADIFYCVVVGFGLHFIGEPLLRYTHYTQLFVGVLLIITGIVIFRKHMELTEDRTIIQYIGDFVSALSINGLNPTLLITFSALFVALGMTPYIGDILEMISFMLGMVVGQIVFWYSMGTLLVMARKHQRADLVRQVQRILGVILGIIGFIIFTTSLIKFFL